MKKITKEMVMKLNNELSVMGCPFRYVYEETPDVISIPRMKITLSSMNCVSSCIINVEKEFLDWLELWFKTNYDIELTCNNTGSTLWSKN